MYIRTPLCIGPELCGLPRTLVLGTWVNKGKRDERQVAYSKCSNCSKNSRGVRMGIEIAPVALVSTSSR